MAAPVGALVAVVKFRAGGLVVAVTFSFEVQLFPSVEATVVAMTRQWF